MNKNKIEFAKLDDISQLTAMCFTVFEENNLKETNTIPDCNKILEEMFKSIIEHVVLVKRNDKNSKLIDGFLVLQAGSTWWTNEVFLNSLIFYIKPEFRSFKLAKDLLNEAKKYAIINNTPLVFDIFDKKNGDKKIKLLKYLGFKDYGSSLIFVGEVKENE